MGHYKDSSYHEHFDDQIGVHEIWYIIFSHSQGACSIISRVCCLLVAHGVDWGSIIARGMACTHDENCKALSTTLNISLPPLPTPSILWAAPLKVAKFMASLALGSDRVYGKGKLKILGRSFADIENDKDAGYRAIQGTRPYTLSYGLSDSPVGLLGMYKACYTVCFEANITSLSLVAGEISRMDPPRRR
jgi:hypothetical protein